MQASVNNFWKTLLGRNFLNIYLYDYKRSTDIIAMIVESMGSILQSII